MIEDDHAIRYVFFDSVAGQGVLTTFACDDRCDTSVLEPLEEPAQLGAQHHRIGKTREQRFDRVEHDAFCSDRRDRVVEADEEGLEVKFAGLFEFTAFDLDVIDQQLAGCDQRADIEPEGRDVVCEIGACLLERHEHAVLSVLADATNEKLHGQKGLAATGRAADQRRPSTRKPPIRDLVQAADAAG